MAQTTTPKKTSAILPNWSQPTRPSLGRDPLGIQATSVRVYRGLVPGLTNVTNRLRYYSFYCWVIRHYEEKKHSDDEAKWRVFIRRAEPPKPTDYASPEEFRRSLSKRPATGDSGRFSLADPGLLELWAII